MKRHPRLPGLLSGVFVLAFMLGVGLLPVSAAQEQESVSADLLGSQNTATAGAIPSLDAVDYTRILNSQLDGIQDLFPSGSPEKAVPQIVDRILSNAESSDDKSSEEFVGMNFLDALSPSGKTKAAQVRGIVEKAAAKSPNLSKKALSKLVPWINLFQTNEAAQKAMAAALERRNVDKWRRIFDGYVANGKVLNQPGVHVPQGRRNAEKEEAARLNPPPKRLPNGRFEKKEVVPPPPSQNIAERELGDFAQNFLRSLGKKKEFRSGNGKYIFESGIEGTVHMFLAATGVELPHSFKGHTDKVLAFVLSPDGQFLYTAGYDGSVRKWEVATGKQVQLFPGHAAILSIDLSPDGRLLYSAGQDGLVREWDTNAGKEITPAFQEPGHNGAVLWVKAARDGQSVYSAGLDGTFRKWNRSTRKEAVRFLGLTGVVLHPTLAEDDQFLYGADTSGKILEWETSKGGRVAEFEGYQGTSWDYAPSSDRSHVFAVNRDRNARLFDAGGKLVKNIKIKETSKDAAGAKPIPAPLSP